MLTARCTLDMLASDVCSIGAIDTIHEYTLLCITIANGMKSGMYEDEFGGVSLQAELGFAMLFGSVGR